MAKRPQCEFCGATTGIIVSRGGVSQCTRCQLEIRLAKSPKPRRFAPKAQ